MPNLNRYANNLMSSKKAFIILLIMAVLTAIVVAVLYLKQQTDFKEAERIEKQIKVENEIKSEELTEEEEKKKQEKVIKQKIETIIKRDENKSDKTQTRQDIIKVLDSALRKTQEEPINNKTEQQTEDEYKGIEDRREEVKELDSLLRK